MELNNRVALITGAGGGIGKAIAVALAKEGATLVLFGGNNLDNLAKTKGEVESVGAKCFVYPCNLTCDSELDVAFDKMIKEVGSLDILINNAGVAQSTEIEDISKESFDKIMGINFRAPFMLTQKCLPILKKSDRASIINIASVVAHAGYPLQSVYTASKHALLGFTKSLAQEVFEDGIRVHAISPGGVYTDMIKVSRPDLTGEGMIMPEDIADTVMFLLKNRTNAVIDEILLHRVNKTPFLV